MLPFKCPKVIAHRGASAVAPENTLIAFQEAKNTGCNWIEFDVELSKDGIPVIMHDERLNRTTTGRGAVDSFTLKELKKMDAGSYKAAKFAGQSIPTLKETLDFIRENHMHANVELKSIRGNSNQDVRLAQAASEVLGPYVRGDNNIIISSFSPSLLAESRKYFPKLPMALCKSFLSTGALLRSLDATTQQISDLNCCALHVNERIINSKTFLPLKSICPHILCWTVNDIERAKHLFDMGLAGLFTDDPGLFKQF